MILKSYYDLAGAIRDAMPDLAWIDIDKGQFDNPENFNTVLLPGLLIKFSAIEWETLGQKRQLGDGTVTLKLAVYLPAQTHESDPLFATNLDSFALATVLNQAVAGVDFMRTRVGSDEYPVQTFYVIEQTYTVCLAPDPPGYKTLTVPVVFNPQIVPHL